MPELAVSNFDASLQFYINILGFSIWFQRGHAPQRFAYLDRDGAQIMLEEVHGGIWQTGELAKPYGRGVNFQIECADAGVVLDALVAANYPVWRGLQEAWRDIGSSGTLSGSQEFLVQDPDGYLLRFTQDLGRRPTKKPPFD